MVSIQTNPSRMLKIKFKVLQAAKSRKMMGKTKLFPKQKRQRINFKG